MSRIPDNMIVFFHDKATMPEVFQDCVDTSLSANPEFNLIFMDDAETRRLIADHFPHFRDLYDRVRVPAARADIARLLALYHHGGIYIDISMAFRVAFRSLLGEDNALFLVRRDDAAVYRGRTHLAHLVNGIMAAAPGSDLILKCLQRIYYNISEGFINYSVNVATGPNVITETFMAARKDFSFPYTIGLFSDLKTRCFDYRRVPGLNNAWLETQREGILSSLPETAETPQERAWREFLERDAIKNPRSAT